MPIPAPIDVVAIINKPLIVFKSYYGYIICTILNKIFTNSITAFYSNKYYPQYQCKGDISLQRKLGIRKNIQGLMVGKICMASRNAFDNIFLSMFLGLNIVTIYGNYYYIMNAISEIVCIKYIPNLNTMFTLLIISSL